MSTACNAEIPTINRAVCTWSPDPLSFYQWRVAFSTMAERLYDLTISKWDHCGEGDLWEYDLGEAVTESVVEYFDPVGGLDQTIPDKPLYQVETPELNITTTVGESRVRLQIKDADDFETKASFEACLDAYVRAELL